jgi:outer membrane lipoprotein-sorting protein
MKHNRLFSVSAFLVITSITSFALTIDEGQALLERIDLALNHEDTDFASVMTMVSEDPETGIEKRVVQQYRRDSEGKFLMLFVEPVTQRGQGYLMSDDSLWFYDPESRKFSHTSMKEQFAESDAKNSDFGSSSIASDYRVVSVEEGNLGKYEVYIMELEATNNEVTYPREKIWVTRDTSLVLKSEDSSANGRLMRTSYFPGYTEIGGKYLPTKMIFVDNLIEGRKTQITITDVSVERLPDALFTKAYIERVSR